ncbi:MAG: electron transport complex subunit RsxC [Bacteroidales bacterium]|nr:electron transport complex subunit RsxC [Bacteroidales bacterium]
MLKTFTKGGVHPPENKLSAARAIETAALPTSVFIPLGQHIGAPATPTVKKGDRVKVGSKIGQPAGFVSAGIHSSVSGVVSKLDAAPDSSGYPKPGIFIDVEGDEWEEDIDRTDTLISDFNIDGPAIIAKISNAGIVGMGGATFPTHVKLAPPPNSKAEILLINGVECEPYLTADHRLMLEKSRETVVGIRLLMCALGVTKAAVGIENNKPDAIAAMRKAATDGIEIVPLKVKYPQGGEKQLIKAVTGREVPSGALPIAVGAVVSNVGTAFAVYEAVQKNKPLIERIVTVTGKSLAQPSNFRTRIGTPLSALIVAAGGMPSNTGKIVCGGPMMGRAIASAEMPVTKGTSGILLLDADESTRPQTLNCIRCARCVEACPMSLEPYLLTAVSEKQLWERAENENIMDCIECGSCSFTCPAARPLLDYIRLGKATVGSIIRNRKK